MPLIIIISTAERGFFRKPRPGIWYWLRNVANKDDVIDVENSFYCGDAAGRRVGWAHKRKKDFSCSDRLFASNLGIKFYTPEEYFMGHKATNLFDLPGFDPQQGGSDALLDPEMESMVADKQDMVMMVGIQAYIIFRLLMYILTAIKVWPKCTFDLATRFCSRSYKSDFVDVEAVNTLS